MKRHASVPSTPTVIADDPIPDTHDLTASEWRAIIQHFGDAVSILRHEPPLADLETSEWGALVAILYAWTSGDRNPTQVELAAHAGLSTRTLQRVLPSLERGGLIDVTRDGRTVTAITPGRNLVPLLRDFALFRHPQLWTRHLGQTHSAVARGDGAHATMAREVPEPHDTAARREPARDAVSSASGLINKEEDLTSLFFIERGPSATTDGASPTPTPVDAATSRRLALQALAELHRRANPGIPLPRSCEGAHVRLVEACTAQGAWDAATLEQTHLDAITGAFERSTSGPPTPRFIWGKYFFFLKNAGIGRALRLKTRPAPPRRPPPEDPPAPPEWVARHVGAAGEELNRIFHHHPTQTRRVK